MSALEKETVIKIIDQGDLKTCGASLKSFGWKFSNKRKIWWAVLEKEPDLIESLNYGVKVAACEWKKEEL